jgi:hypothetical protein
MSHLERAELCVCRPDGRARFAQAILKVAVRCIAILMLCSTAAAQNVVTQHYDIGRSGGQNAETILAPSNVNATSFGRLFQQTVDAQVYAQPLYVAGLTIPGKGVHNVVFVATENDSIYAFDADNNGGVNSAALWAISLLDSAHGAASGATAVPQGDLSSADITPFIGITGTPVIDTSTNTMYVVGKTKESGTYIQRLHALDITTGQEKFAGPVVVAASAPGNGNGSTGGTLSFDPKWENNRAGLLLLNGIVYLPFAAHGDNGPWHGWILAYNAATLKQTSVWSSSPNGIGAGMWMGGSGLAADTLNPTGSSPGGRIFVATGNGTFDATKPYNTTMDYGDSIVRLDLNNGAIKVGDIFTPSNQANLNSQDLDVASGGVLLLPDQSGAHTHLALQIGKDAHLFIVDRDNMGGFNTTNKSVEDFYVNAGSFSGYWGMPTYGNNTVYVWTRNDNLKTYPLSAGAITTSPTQTGSITAGFPSPTAAITSNNGSGPILWLVQTDSFGSGGSAILRAYDATNINNNLYSSSTNNARDNAGAAVKFVVPTVTHGKVYVGSSGLLSVYGLLNGSAQAAAPAINPASQSFTGTIQVSITDSTPNAQIYYSTTGTATTSSTPYSGPITVNTTETISAIASAPGFLQSTAVSQTFTLQTQTVMPTFSVLPGAYASTQSVVISDASPNPTIYYAINGPASTSSTPFAGSATVSVAQSETINAIATSPNLSASPQASATYTIGGTNPVSFPNGFSASASTMTFNGTTKLDDTRLQLTDGLTNEAASAWFNTPVNIQSFSTTFAFQLSNANADGFTFCIQNTGLAALGPLGGGLGYGPTSTGGGGFLNSIAVKFDLYDNNGEGPNSTGLYLAGNPPSTPAIDLTASGVNLHSGDAMTATLVYDGAKLTLTITDGVVNKSFTTSWTVNIPQALGANTGYVGFTGGTGGQTASQKILTWSFSNTAGATPAAATPGFSPAGGAYSGTQSVTLSDATAGSTIFYTTDGSTPASSVGGTTKQATGPVSVGTSQTIKAIATAPGFSPSAVGTAVYTISSQPATATPVISPGTGTYASAQTVSITDSTPGATIFYALNGTASPSSTKYTAPFVVSSTTTVNAIATATNFATSATASSAITIQSSGGSAPINFASGFSAGGLQFNGHTKLNGARLQLTDTTATQEVASAFWTTPVSISSFTNDFTFQLTNPSADGFTFTLQGVGPTAIGAAGGGLGYSSLTNSVAVKFDLYDNNGEGINSTGLFLNGAAPATPATTLGGGVNLHSGDIFHVVMSYDGTTLTMTITDTVNTAQTFSISWPVNIAPNVGGTTAYAGFTGGTGGLTATQEILTWTFSNASGTQSAAAIPTFNPPAGTYSGTQPVTIADTTPGATIFYTTNGSTPATAAGGSTLQYGGAINVGASETINAIATAPGFTASAVGSAAYTITTLPAAATPVINPSTGNYTGTQTVSITDSTPGATIYYALNGPVSTNSNVYSTAFVVNSTTTVNAIAVAPNFATSATATSAIGIQTTSGSTPINFAAGFSAGGMQFNGNTVLNGTRLQLTNSTVTNGVGSAFWTTPVSVSTFTSDFTFQLSNPAADGFTFTLQNVAATALGPGGGGLGYGPDTPGGTGGIAKSVAVKFDLFDNDGEGTNSTGLYVSGASPTLPATTLGGGVNLHSGDILHAVIGYDGTTLTLTLTDTANTAQTFSASWPINIVSTIGSSTAFAGFTAGTGGQTATQEIVTWTYTASATSAPKTPIVYNTTTLPAASSGPVWRQFAYAGFPDGIGMILDAAAVGDSITLTLNVPTAGVYDVKASFKALNTRGVWQLAVNGTNVGAAQDEYQNTGNGVYVTSDVGNFNFATAGNYAVKFSVAGKNAASSGYSISFDDITLTPQ